MTEEDTDRLANRIADVLEQRQVEHLKQNLESLWNDTSRFEASKKAREEVDARIEAWNNRKRWWQFWK